MDTDDCSEENKEKFINKEMFKNHWAYDYIVPIYNSPNLEKALDKLKIPNRKNEKRKFIEFLPIDEKYIKTDIEQLQEVVKLLTANNNKCTNLAEFINHCLKLATNK